MGNLKRFDGQEYRLTLDISPARKGAYLISRDLIARPVPNWELYYGNFVNPNLDSELAHLNNEYEIFSEAYKLGINVPKPEGIFNVALSNFESLRSLLKPILTPALVIERINGIPIDNISDENERVSAEVCLDEELRKAKERGFNPFDSIWEDNSLWDPVNKKIYLIDVDCWKRLKNN